MSTVCVHLNIPKLVFVGVLATVWWHFAVKHLPYYYKFYMFLHIFCYQKIPYFICNLCFHICAIIYVLKACVSVLCIKILQ
jgi:hypothetical protein